MNLSKPTLNKPITTTIAFPLFLIFGFILLQLSGDEAVSSLCYNRNAIQEGQLWRLLIGHFIHHGWSHLGMNVGGLILIWMLVGKRTPISTLTISIVFSSLCVSFGLFLLNPEISTYVGFSGTLHGVWATSAVITLRTEEHWEARLLLLLLVAKLLWEQILGPLPGSTEMANVTIVVDAHLYGAITGLIIAAAHYLNRK